MEIDYKKEYEAMVQRARELHETGNELTKRQMEIVCHELRESEDERIRKELIAILKKSYNSGITLNNKKDLDRYLAYLEKQKESLHIQKTCKENADSFTDACKDVIVAIEKYLDWLTGYPDYAPKGKYSIRDMLYCLSLLEKQKEPENVSATTMIPSCWEVEQKEQKPTIAGNDFGWIDELKHDLKHPEELDQKVDDVLKQRKGIRALEWSEEDKEHLDSIIESYKDLLKDYKACHDVDYIPYQSETICRNVVDDIIFLKSLRPAWKPSEEQMRVLSWAANGMVDKCIAAPEMRAVLRELYVHLKKLGVKEEPEYHQHFDPDC